MLSHLVSYARTRGLQQEPGFAQKSVRWAIAFDDRGNFLGVTELGEAGARRNPGRTFTNCPDLSQPELVQGREARCHFLVESASVVALLGAEDAERERNKHRYFVWLLREASAAMPALGPCADALDNPDTLGIIRQRLADQRARPTDKVTLRCGNVFPVESDSWHDWWRRLRASLRPDTPAGQRMRCLVSGNMVVPAATHPKVRGLADVGGSSTGSSLISFDKDAFTSYGLDQSANCAVSEETAAAYRSALEELLRSHSQTLGQTKLTHWFKEAVPPEDDPLPWLADPAVGAAQREEADAQARAARLLRSIREGRRPDLAGNRYYALTLSGAAGRVMVREWMEGSFEELVGNIIAWFDDLAITRREGNALAPPPKFVAVLGATVRELADLASPLTTAMLRAAIRGDRIPFAALAQALRRATMDILSDQAPSHARYGLMRAYHVRKNRMEGGKEMAPELQPYLNESHSSPAYHCGRLLAVLAQLQRAALGDVGAGVVQRYYAAASSTPALVLGRLTRTSQHHLGKLDPRLAYWYNTLIGRIYSQLQDSIPRTLDLESQSLFALGYYQQLAAMRTRTRDEAPDSQTAPSDDDSASTQPELQSGEQANEA